MTAGKSSCPSNGRGRSLRLFEGNRLSRGHLCRLMPKLCSAITGLLYSIAHNTVSTITELFKLAKTQWSVAIEDATRDH